MAGSGAADVFAEKGPFLDSLVKRRLSEMQNDLPLEELLQIASLVDSDPMLDCLIELDRKSWLGLESLFETYSVEDKRKKFMAISASI